MKCHYEIYMQKTVFNKSQPLAIPQLPNLLLKCSKTIWHNCCSNPPIARTLLSFSLGLI